MERALRFLGAAPRNVFKRSTGLKPPQLAQACHFTPIKQLPGSTQRRFTQHAVVAALTRCRDDARLGRGELGGVAACHTRHECGDGGVAACAPPDHPCELGRHSAQRDAQTTCEAVRASSCARVAFERRAVPDLNARLASRSEIGEVAWERGARAPSRRVVAMRVSRCARLSADG